MSASTYALIFTLAPYLVATAAVLAERRGGRRGLAVTWLLSAALFSYLGYRDWTSPPDEGTPLSAYLLFATLPTAAAVLVIARMARARAPLIVRILLAGTAGWAMIFPILLVYTALLG